MEPVIHSTAELREIRIRLRAATYATGAVADAASPPAVARAIAELLDRIAYERRVALTPDVRASLAAAVAADVVGWGPLQALMDDPEVTEIMVNGPWQVYAERRGHKALVQGVAFDDEAHLLGLVSKVVRGSGRRVDQSMPMADFALADGSRVNVVLPPAGHGGPYVTVRKFLRGIERVEDLVERGTLDARMATLLTACVRGRITLLFSGATGSGKTTTLEVLSAHVPPDERLVVIEDTLELALRQPHVVRLLTRQPNHEGKGEITARELFMNALRMRPTRILVGELRGREALEYLQALGSGHGGSLAVVHSAGPEDAVLRLETLALQGGVPVPVGSLRRQIARGVQLVVHQALHPDGVRRIERISELSGPDDAGEVVVRDVFRFVPEGVDPSGRMRGGYRATGVVPGFVATLAGLGAPVAPEVFRADGG